MSRPSAGRIQRQSEFVNLMKEDPFMSDEELADYFNVSIPTIRHDRIELQIPQLRERVRGLAAISLDQIKSLRKEEFVGTLIELDLNRTAKSYMETQPHMVFEKSQILRGQYIYSMAESIAIAVINAEVALVGVANIKYRVPVMEGETMVANAELKRIKGNTYTVWVSITVKAQQVFRGKFLLVSI